MIHVEVQSYELDQDSERDAVYKLLCDGLIEDEQDVRFVISTLWRVFKEGKQPVVAIFLPQEEDDDGDI